MTHIMSHDLSYSLRFKDVQFYETWFANFIAIVYLTLGIYSTSYQNNLDFF